MLAWQIMAILQRKREEEARRRAEVLRGAIVGAPADPEVFG